MNDLDKAKNKLVENISVVFVKGETTYTSALKGLNPLFALEESIKDLNGYSVADRIVGKAAAMLFVHFGIKEVYGEVMSKDGKRILEEYNIPYSYKTLVDNIINRKGDDICPMEKTVVNTENINEAYILLKEKNELLNR